MSKTIEYSCLLKTASVSEQYSGENNVTTLVINFADTGVDDWNKWFDVRLADGSGTSVSLGTGVSCTFTLSSDYMYIGGKVIIEPYAISGTGQIQYYEKFSYNVKKVLGTSGTWQPYGEIGYRTLSGSPVGSFTPSRLGEEVLDIVGEIWWKATGLTVANWKQITN